MKNRVIKTVTIILAITMLLLLTGCGTTENIKALQEAKFHNWSGETEYTYKQVMDMVMNNVSWSEYKEDEEIYIRVKGIEKSTGNNIEIVYSKYGDTFKREATLVNGEDEGSTYYNSMFTDIH